jgi:hypothetical protein
MAAWIACVACGGGGAPEAAAPKPTNSSSDGGEAAQSQSSASSASGSAGGAQADGGQSRPFAGSVAEATQLIQDALEKQTDAMADCVKRFRFRKHLAHERVDVAVGIDQEGHVLGVTLPKRKPDDELSKCIMTAVHDAPFPKSHAGVITVTRSFEEMVR